MLKPESCWRAMNARPHTAQYGPETAYLRPLAERVKGTSRAVNADSRVCVRFAAVWLCRNNSGCDSGSMLHSNGSPRVPKGPVSCGGECIAALTEEDDVKLLAAGWDEKNRQLVVRSYGCTVQRRGVLSLKALIVEQYFNEAAAIDIHIYSRQGGLSLETALQGSRGKNRR